MRAFPADARSRAGYQLRLLQEGLEPDDHRPMPAVGLGVQELRIHTTLEHRVIFVTRFPEGIFVLHAFQKKSQRTARRDLSLAQERYRQMRSWRKEHQEETGGTS
jgi:phage-related protein